LIPNCVAGYVDGVARRLQPKRKSDNIAGYRLDARRAVAGGGRCYEKPASIGRAEHDGVPRRKAAYRAAEPLRAGARGKHSAGLIEKRPAAPVEIVGMLVMTEEHGVDPAHLIGGERGAFLLRQRHSAGIVATRRIEGGICEEAEPGRFDEHSRAANKRERCS